MLIAVRAEVESVSHWREQFKTHNDLFKRQGVSVAHMGATDDQKVLALFETDNLEEFVRIFNDPATANLIIHNVPYFNSLALVSNL